MKVSPLVAFGTAVLLLLGGAVPLAAQTIGSNFTGASFFDGAGLPPDTDGAIGSVLTTGTNAGVQPFAEFVNGLYSVYDAHSSGQTNAPLNQISDTEFWSSPLNDLSKTTGVQYTVSDPRLIFDPVSSRWFASSITVPVDQTGNPVLGPNHFLVAVSNSSDPTDLTGGWSRFVVNANPSTGSQNLFADFDQLGLNGDRLYLGANMFTGSTSSNPGTLASTSFVSIPLANLLTGTVSATDVQRTDYQNYLATGPTAHPVLDLDHTPGVEWVLSDNNTDPNATALTTQLQLSRFVGTAFTTVNGTVTVSGGLNQPLGARQPGGANPLETNDPGFSGHVVKKNGEIWAVQTASVGGHDVLHWVRINAATGVLIGEGTLGDPSHDYFFGSIAVNGLGDVVIAATRSGPLAQEGDGTTGFAGSYAFVGKTSGSQTVFGAPLLLKAGVAPFDLSRFGLPNRWGDYSTTMLDPSNPFHFWTIQQWASGVDQELGTPNYSLQISEIIVPAPEPSSLATLAIGVLGIAGLCRRRAAGGRRTGSD